MGGVSGAVDSEQKGWVHRMEVSKIWDSDSLWLVF